MVGRGGAGQNKYPGADDGADAEENELPWAEGFDKAGILAGFLLKVIDLFCAQKTSEECHSVIGI